MTLSDHQWEFLKDVAKLIQYAESIGIKLTGGELYRTADQQWLYYEGYEIEHDKLKKTTPKSKTMNSYHLRRLAIDFNVFINKVLTYEYKDIEPLGIYWINLNKTYNRWGGDWNRNGKKDDGFLDTPHFERKIYKG